MSEDILNYKDLPIDDLELEDIDNPKFKSKYFYLEDAYKLYKSANKNHIADYILRDENFKEKFFKISPEELNFDDVNPVKIQELTVKTTLNNLNSPRIAFANTEVKEENIVRSIRGDANLDKERYRKLASILKKARKEKADILLFPECFIPINLLSSIVRYAERNQCLTITGLEHLNIDKAAFNFIITILPVEIDGIKDSIVVFRIKNHYSPGEEFLISKNHLSVPKPKPYRYDIFNWRNIYFSSFYCFELANSLHRSLFKGKIDLLVGVEWNRDTNYFSNIVEASSRDLHVFVAQVNTSQYGDTRLTQPKDTNGKDLLKLKGGTNDAILITNIDIDKLREFQRQKIITPEFNGDFKPLPPDFSYEDVIKRIENKSILKNGK
ncbi:hypothetical protein N9R54_01295 [Pelobium sp.]|nr:hypothetical protein [Pelobium sp.]MDA9554845.1 hypothetical protein [Pelobium sp.]